MGYILSLSLACLRIGSVYLGCLGKSSISPEEKNCLDNLNSVRNLNELKNFLDKLRLGISKDYFTYIDVSNCLGFSRDSKVFLDTLKLNDYIYEAEHLFGCKHQ